MDTIDEFTPSAVQDVCHSPHKYHVGDPLEEKNQEVGHSHVGENQVYGPVCMASAGWRSIG